MGRKGWKGTNGKATQRGGADIKVGGAWSKSGADPIFERKGTRTLINARSFFFSTPSTRLQPLGRASARPATTPPRALLVGDTPPPSPIASACFTAPSRHRRHASFLLLLKIEQRGAALVHRPPARHFHLCLAAPGTSATTPVTMPVTTHLPFFFLLRRARDPFSICLEPPRFQEPLPLPQVPRTARHAAVDTSHQRKRRRRETNSASRLLSRFSSHARDGCHSPCDSPPPRQPHCD